MRTILIGLDDTDNPTSPGTGRLARDLCAQLARLGLTAPSVTRHQFLVNPAIPFTSHNSGACIAAHIDNGTPITDFVCDFIARHAAPGSDPGVCLALADEVPLSIRNFGRTAQQSVLKIEQAFAQTTNTPVKLRGLGGNCLGVIGALAAVGLRAQGSDGRFIDLPGLRDLPRHVDAARFHALGIEILHQSPAPATPRPPVYDTLDWARPRLLNGKPLLLVEWSESENAWTPVDRKKSHSTPPRAQP